MDFEEHVQTVDIERMISQLPAEDCVHHQEEVLMTYCIQTVSHWLTSSLLWSSGFQAQLTVNTVKYSIVKFPVQLQKFYLYTP